MLLPASMAGSAEAIGVDRGASSSMRGADVRELPAKIENSSDLD